jgi:aspartate racemase
MPKTVGVIGGLGPETTSKFYMEIMRKCGEIDMERRPSILIHSIPISYKAEADAQIRAAGANSLLPLLTNSAKRLEAAGADIIVMPCNSLHIFISQIRASVHVPVLSILEETARLLKKEKITRVGMISTTLSRRNKLYSEELSRYGICYSEPDEKLQPEIGKIINNLVLDRSTPSDRRLLAKIIDSFVENGTTDILLACTDLQLAMPKRPGARIFDTMDILVDATIGAMLH